MTVEFWQNAERFYEYWLMNIFSLIVLTLIVMIFAFTYTMKGKRKKPFTILFSIVGVLALVGGIGHIHYRDYLEQAMHVNPLIRDRKATYLGYSAFGSSEEMFYTELNDLNALRKMALYEEVVIKEPLIYFGTNGYSHYFERENGDLFRHSQRISFHEDLEEPQLVGSRFVLKDEGFTDIGFKNPEYTMFSDIVLPDSEADKEFKPEFETDFLRAETIISDWNF